MNQKWRERLNWTEPLKHRSLSTSSVSFTLHSEHADHHVEKAYSSIEKRTKSKKSFQIKGGNFNAELGPGIGIERVSVGPHIFKESNKR